MPTLDNRVALVTGASGALGQGVTETFLAAGATVIGAARSRLPGTGNRLLSVEADLTTPPGAQSAVEETLHLAKRIDVLVHVMGGFAGGQTIAETDDKTWEKMMDLNLRAAFYVTWAALPHMVAAGYGRIVAVGSRVGVEPAATLGPTVFLKLDSTPSFRPSPRKCTTRTSRPTSCFRA